MVAWGFSIYRLFAKRPLRPHRRDSPLRRYPSKLLGLGADFGGDSSILSIHTAGI